MKFKSGSKIVLLFFFLFVMSLSGLITLYFLGNLDDLRYLSIGLLLLSIVSLFLAALFFSRNQNRKTIVNLLLEENEYNFGKTDSGFYNLSLFMRRVSQIKKIKRNKEKEQYLIAFTASNLKVMRNFQRDDTIIKLNAAIADEINDMFIVNSSKNFMENHVFGADKGTFFIYSCGDDEAKIKDIIEELRKKVFEIEEKEQLHVWIEPLFGIVRVPANSYIGEDIDNAIIARNASERNFETMTFYHESFRKSANSGDIEDIMEGIKNDEFIVYYQPKFDLNVRKFTSSEALVRWDSPKHGLLSPAKFIPTAEAAGLIHEIDTLVFEKVCQYLQNTKKRGRRLLPVSVNFSLYEFFSIKFLDEILAMMDKYQIDPHLIQIEITETTSQVNQFLSVSIIKKLQDKGIAILMDDFGTGFSNIGNLRKIPFNVIKIDKSYIDNIATDPHAAELVKFLIQLCKMNEMEVVAEGVDNIKQVEILKRYKCDVIQGYYYSKPLPASDYDKFLIKNQFESRERGE